MAKAMSIEVHSSKDGMAVVLNKHALNAIKEGRVGQCNLTSGQGTVVLQLMRDTTFKRIKAEQEQAQKVAKGVAESLTDQKEQPAET